jgi:hypothetical protein
LRGSSQFKPGINMHSHFIGIQGIWKKPNDALCCFQSAFHNLSGDISPSRNNWVCYDAKERMIVPTQSTIRTHEGDSGREQLKWCLIEMFGTRGSCP